MHFSVDRQTPCKQSILKKISTLQLTSTHSLGRLSPSAFLFFPKPAVRCHLSASMLGIRPITVQRELFDDFTSELAILLSTYPDTKTLTILPESVIIIEQVRIFLNPKKLYWHLKKDLIAKLSLSCISIYPPSPFSPQRRSLPSRTPMSPL